MYVKFPLEDLNPNLYPTNLTNIYICGVITTLKVYSDNDL